MKTKDELKIGDIVWINPDSIAELIEEDINSYEKIQIPIEVIVKEPYLLYESSAFLEPVNKESGIPKMTCYFKTYIFYENYEEALADLIEEATMVTYDLRTLANKIEKDTRSVFTIERG